MKKETKNNNLKVVRTGDVITLAKYTSAEIAALKERQRGLKTYPLMKKLKTMGPSRLQYDDEFWAIAEDTDVIDYNPEYVETEFPEINTVFKITLIGKKIEVRTRYIFENRKYGKIRRFKLVNTKLTEETINSVYDYINQVYCEIKAKK